MNLPSPIPKSIFQKDFAVSPSLEPYFILQILGRLKKSLSKALDQFYYLSGRKSTTFTSVPTTKECVC